MGTSRKRGALGLGLIATLVAALAIAGAASGNHWPAYQGTADKHELVEGNPALCAEPNGGKSFRLDKSELTLGGVYPAGNPIVRITALDIDGGTLSWELVNPYGDYDMAAVVMKGGNNAMVYYYDAAGTGVDDSDSGLTTPVNPENGKPYGISHVDFCLDPKDDVGVDDLQVTKTTQTAWEKVYTWDVEKSVDKPQLVLPAGGSGNVNWTVQVTQTGSTARNAVVSGTINVQNPNDVAVTGVAVSDALAGAVVDCDAAAGAQNTGLTVPANGSISCTYSAPRDTIDGGTNSATATGTLEGIDVSDSGTADFAFGAPAVEVNKAVSAVDDENEWTGIDGSDTFSYEETFRCPGQGRTNVVDLLGDNPATPEVETDFVLDTDSASVTVTCGSTPPPPPPPPPTVKTDEFMDVQVSKDATQQVQLVNGQASIAYSVRVRNNGPNQAHNVVLADAAPGGVTFLAVTQQPAVGNCTVSAALLSCTLGTLGPGVERTIGVSARVAQTGTYVNCATGTGSGKDTNGANNTACASTLVTAPVTPPTTKPKPPVSKPKPKPVVNICRVLKVTPGMVKANGKRQLVLAKVTRSKTPVKGVQVRFTSKGLSKAVKTNKQGVARLSVTPSRAGIMLVKITSVKACNSARIGVVGVFEPPVTG
jgi:uncharacterized repeat protein (TIGR01451 family)